MRTSIPSLALAACALVSVDASAQVGASVNATMMSRFDPTSSYNDVWGFVDPATGKEYAVLGARAGTYIVDASDPTNPIQRGFIPGPSSTWRDMRYYQGYVYSVTEGGGGVQIIDVRNPDSPTLVNTWGQGFFSSAHNVALDTSTGILYPCGTSNGVVIASLADPVNPTFLGNYNSSYLHDLQVQDGWAHLGEINSSRYRILEIQNAPSWQILGNASVPSSHQVWPTRDNNYAVTSSESTGGIMRVFDISNKSAPQRIANWRTGNSFTSVHNAFIRDRVIYAAYYSEGFRAVDISDPSRPRGVCYYDTSNSTSGFTGAWGCYPFQPSGSVYISDISGGLYIFDTPASTRLFGGGTTTGGGDLPAIHTFGAPFSGNADFAFEIENSPAGATVTLLIGVAPTDLTVFGLNLLIDLAQPHLVISGSTDASGKVKIDFPLPTGLPSARIYVQALVEDPGGPIGLASTQGMEVELFRRSSDT
jgi:choice-of-anchor B domain-containing protein